MVSNVLTLDFWDEEERRLWEQAARMILPMLMAGGKGGHDALPPEAQILVNWDIFNQDAVNYLKQYRLDWVRGIHENTRDRAVEIIGDWVEAGEPLPVLEAKLTPLFGPERAEMIASTEVTRIYADGNKLAWQASGVVSMKQWKSRPYFRQSCLIY